MFRETPAAANRTIAKGKRKERPNHQGDEEEVCMASDRIRSEVAEGDKAMRPAPKKQKPNKECEHGRRRYYCKDCGGAGICEHGRVRARCKECGGSGLCEHGKLRSVCKDCGGSQICEHGRRRSQCKECGGG